MMLAAFPDCVRTERIAEAFGPQSATGLAYGPIVVWKSFADLTPSGVRGDGRRASAEKGEKLFEIAATLLAEQLIAGEPWS
jgi:creatinine amidohydrolase